MTEPFHLLDRHHELHSQRSNENPQLAYYQLANLQTYQPSNRLTCQPTNLQTFKPANLQTFKPTNLPTSNNQVSQTQHH